MKKLEPCAACTRLRWFLSCAGLLIVLIGLQPAAAIRIAGLMPNTTALALAMLAAMGVAFAVRYATYRNSRGMR